ncbi:hypothetical protein [Chromobacterium sp. Panama]|uniref:hypothetical protein n=1 Tax=Chromobacterium sp. Panama TaxID=2161826 RepID=UPI0011B265EB|nr:hypothetical protein [Chromobacterium sp. Panama]
MHSFINKVIHRVFGFNPVTLFFPVKTRGKAFCLRVAVLVYLDVAQVSAFFFRPQAMPKAWRCCFIMPLDWLAGRLAEPGVCHPKAGVAFCEPER